MTKRIVAFAIVLLASIMGCAQSLTPNISLYLPGHNQQNWDIPLNQDFTLLDKYLSGNLQLPKLSMAGYFKPGLLTVGSFPTAPFGAEVMAVDPVNQFDCKIGGGTYPTPVKCIYLGVTLGWQPELPAPTTTSGGAVQAKTCGGSAIMSINNDSTVTCAASSTGGNGGIYNTGPTSPTSGNSTWQTIYTYTLPAGTLSTTGGLEVTCGFITTGIAADFRMVFGSQVFPVGGFFSPSQIGPGEIRAKLFNQSATNSQWYSIEASMNNLSPGTPYWYLFAGNNLSVDTTVSQAISCQVDLTSAGTWQGAGFFVARAQQ